MKTSYVICFVCGGKGASCILYVKPRTHGAYFSFLENHDPPKGAKLPNGEGVVNACLVCYAFLNQQWDSFEKTKTPLVKRLYWLKRIDNRSFTGAELNVQGEYVAQIMGVQYNCGVSGDVSPFEYGSHTGISCHVSNPLPSPVDESDVSPSLDEKKLSEVPGVLDLSVSPKKPKVTGKKPQKLEETGSATKSSVPLTSGNRNRNRSIVCYVCAKPCSASLARFIYAIDQSDDDDEPHFPFLLELPEPPGAMPLTKNGVTQVCSECRKTLNRQWRIFDSQKVPISDRVYKIKDFPIASPGKLTKENKSAEGVCCLCDEMHLLNSMHAVKMSRSNSVDGTPSLFQFVEKLRCISKITTDSCGVLLICSSCHIYVLSRWKQSDENDLSVPKPVLNGTGLKVPDASPNGTSLSNDRKLDVQRKNSVAIIDESMSDPGSKDRTLQSIVTESLYINNTVASPGYSHGTFKLPFDSPVLQVKTDCNKNTVMKAKPTTPVRDKEMSCNGRAVVSQKQVLKSDICQKLELDSICFLCGFKCTKLGQNCTFSSVTICDRPSVRVPKDRPSVHVLKDRPSVHVPKISNESTNSTDCPFFPFLGTLMPSPGAEAITADGCVNVCLLCHRNLVTQWNLYEKSNEIIQLNRWHRNYEYRSFICNACGENYERQNMEIVSVERFQDFEKFNISAVGVKSDECVLLCSMCCIRGKMGNRLNGKLRRTSSCLSTPRCVVGKYSQNETDSIVTGKSEDESYGSLPVVAEGVSSISDHHQWNRSSSTASVTTPSPPSKSLSSPSPHSPKQEKWRNADFNTSDEVKKLALCEKLRDGEAPWCEVSVDTQKSFHSENPTVTANYRNGLNSTQEHFAPNTNQPLAAKYTSGIPEDFTTTGTASTRSLPLSSALSSANVSPSPLIQFDGFPRITSSLATTSDGQMVSNAGCPSFIPHPFPLMPDSVYPPDGANPSSVLGFPLSNSCPSFSWENYQMMQNYQSMMSSCLTGRSFFHPSFVHPMLSFNPNVVPPFFYPTNSLSSASVSSSSAFDLATSFLRRGVCKSPDADGSDSCTESISADSELDVCTEKADAPRRFTNGGNRSEKNRKNCDRSGRTHAPARVLLEEKGKADDGSLVDRTEPRYGEKDSSPPRRKTAVKHIFHRPFLENSPSDEEKSEGVAKQKKEHSERNDDEETMMVGSSLSRGDPANCPHDSKRRNETTSLHASPLSLKNQDVVKQQIGSNPNNSLGKLPSYRSTANSFSNGMNGERQCKDERMSAAIGLIALRSAQVHSSPEQTTSERDSPNDSSFSDSKSTESPQSNSITLPLNAFETGVGKRLRLDVDCFKSHSYKHIRCDDDCNHGDDDYNRCDDDCNHGIASEIPPLNATGDLPSRTGHVSSISDEDFKAVTCPWPGVDAIIESYQQYCQDCLREKNFLSDRDHQTTQSRLELLSAAERLSNRITELTQARKALKSETIKLQSQLDVFTCMRHPR